MNTVIGDLNLSCEFWFCGTTRIPSDSSLALKQGTDATLFNLFFQDTIPKISSIFSSGLLGDDPVI